MTLESKLGISTGVLILAMLVSASFAHQSVQEANRLATTVADGRVLTSVFEGLWHMTQYWTLLRNVPCSESA